MKIRVDRIPEEGEQIEGSFDPSELKVDMPGCSLAESVAFTGHADKNGDDVLVGGKLHGAVNCECSLCLKKFAMPFDLDMTVVYVPEKERPGDDGDIMDLDPNLSFYEGDVIDLLQEVKDLVLVSLPIKPICQPDCKGLCPQCGTDLNVSDCECERVKVASPFDKLKDLKLKLENK